MNLAQRGSALELDLLCIKKTQLKRSRVVRITEPNLQKLADTPVIAGYQLTGDYEMKVFNYDDYS